MNGSWARALEEVWAVLGWAPPTSTTVLAASEVRAVVVADRPGEGRFLVKVTTAERARVLETSAHAQRVAGAAGVPVAVGLLAGRTPGGFAYLVHERVDGVPWSTVRTTLDRRATRTAHEEIAQAVVALQSVTPDGLGSLLPAKGRAADVVSALVERAWLRIGDDRRRAHFLGVLDAEAGLFPASVPVVTHDDLHQDNLLFAQHERGWRLAAVLDWDKAWAGPAESDVARMAFWDGMTSESFWAVYQSRVPEVDGWERRALVHQLLWCLEYEPGTRRHARDTERVCEALGVPVP